MYKYLDKKFKNEKGGKTAVMKLSTTAKDDLFISIANKETIQLISRTKNTEKSILFEYVAAKVRKYFNMNSLSTTLISINMETDSNNEENT